MTELFDIAAQQNSMRADIKEIADKGGFLPGSFGYRDCADLDGSHARAFLECAGFVVLSNRDKGNYGEAVTECGIHLSTSGYCCRS